MRAVPVTAGTARAPWGQRSARHELGLAVESVEVWREGGKPWGSGEVEEGPASDRIAAAVRPGQQALQRRRAEQHGAGTARIAARDLAAVPAGAGGWSLHSWHGVRRIGFIKLAAQLRRTHQAAGEGRICRVAPLGWCREVRQTTYCGKLRLKAVLRLSVCTQGPPKAEIGAVTALRGVGSQVRKIGGPWVGQAESAAESGVCGGCRLTLQCCGASDLSCGPCSEGAAASPQAGSASAP